MSMQTQGWQLIQRPLGTPTANDVALVKQELQPLQAGEVLVRNSWLSVDPYMRGRMMDVKSYIPPFELGKFMQGGAVGEVIASEDPSIAVGSQVMHMIGWRDLAVVSAKEVTPIPNTGLPLQAALGVLGLTGLTAWAGLNKIGKLKADDTVFVSGAAGAVGSVVCQLAKLKGARVIGSVGSDAKAEFLQSLGVDAVINYKTCGDLNQAVAEAAPEGISLYFDNVGSEHLQAALANMQTFGRLVICGMIDIYNAENPVPGPYNMAEMIRRKLTMQGFIASDYLGDFAEFAQEVGGYLAAGKLQGQETVVEGLENTFEAFLGLFSGKNTGKMLVKL